MKLYMSEFGDESNTLYYWVEKMKLLHMDELKLFEAKSVHNTGFFFCSAYQEIGEKNELCGRYCSEYTPRNGRSGICKNYFLPKEPIKKNIILRVDPKDFIK